MPYLLALVLVKVEGLHQNNGEPHPTHAPAGAGSCQSRGAQVVSIAYVPPDQAWAWAPSSQQLQTEHRVAAKGSRICSQ